MGADRGCSERRWLALWAGSAGLRSGCAVQVPAARPVARVVRPEAGPKLEESLKVRLDFMLFAGLDLHAPVPDETTHCRFRNALVEKGVDDALLAEICHQLEAHGLKLRAAQAAIIDATLIRSAARPRSHIEGIAEDRAEDVAEDGAEDVAEDVAPPSPPEVGLSAEPDAKWVKKGRKSTLGYKGFARCDEEGFVDKVHVTPANAGESPEFGTMIDGASAQRVLADNTNFL